MLRCTYLTPHPLAHLHCMPKQLGHGARNEPV
jgi:hypothetical protein